MHSASLMYQVAPENSEEVDVWAGTYAMPLPGSDARLALYAVSSSSNAQVASAGALSVLGIGQIYGIRYVKPLSTIDNFYHSLTLGADYKNFKENLNLQGADTLKTPISYLPFMVQYNASIRHKEALTTLNAGVNFSVRGVANSQAEFENKRFNARANYAYFTAGATHSHNLPWWDMEVYGRLNGQVANSPLISNEQFSLGGAQTVRGYFETQALADDGIIGSVELRSGHLAPTNLDYINKLQALVFVDGGRGWVQQALAGNAKGYSLASAGLGMRFQLWKYLVGALDLGFPILSLSKVKSGDPRLHFSIATEF
jgi:hemolysin activation/secretion protein